MSQRKKRDKVSTRSFGDAKQTVENRCLGRPNDEVSTHKKELSPTATEAINVLSNRSVNFTKEELAQLASCKVESTRMSCKVESTPMKTYFFDPVKNSLLTSDEVCIEVENEETEKEVGACVEIGSKLLAPDETCALSRTKMNERDAESQKEKNTKETEPNKVERFCKWSSLNIETGGLDDMYDKIEKEFRNKEQDGFRCIYNSDDGDTDFSPEIKGTMKRFISSGKHKFHRADHTKDSINIKRKPSEKNEVTEKIVQKTTNSGEDCSFETQEHHETDNVKHLNVTDKITTNITDIPDNLSGNVKSKLECDATLNVCQAVDTVETGKKQSTFKKIQQTIINANEQNTHESSLCNDKVLNPTNELSMVENDNLDHSVEKKTIEKCVRPKKVTCQEEVSKDVSTNIANDANQVNFNEVYQSNKKSIPNVMGKVVKKRRGRPRKALPIIPSNEISTTTVLNSNNNEEFVECSQNSKPTVIYKELKKHRGRPKKVLPSNHSNEISSKTALKSDNSDESAECNQKSELSVIDKPLKKRRGRPKKALSINHPNEINSRTISNNDNEELAECSQKFKPNIINKALKKRRGKPKEILPIDHSNEISTGTILNNDNNEKFAEGNQSEETFQEVGVSRSGRKHKRINYFEMVNSKLSEHVNSSSDEISTSESKKRRISLEDTPNKHTELNNWSNEISNSIQVPLKKQKLRHNVVNTENKSAPVVSPSYGAVRDFLKETYVIDKEPKVDQKCGDESLLNVTSAVTKIIKTTFDETNSIKSSSSPDKLEAVSPLKKMKEGLVPSSLNPENESTSLASLTDGTAIATSEEGNIQNTITQKEPENSSFFEFDNHNRNSKVGSRINYNFEQRKQEEVMNPDNQEQVSVSEVASLKVRYGAVIDFIKENHDVKPNNSGQGSELTFGDSSKHHDASECHLNIKEKDTLECKDDFENDVDSSLKYSSDSETTSQNRIRRPRGTGDTAKMMKSLFSSSHFSDVLSISSDKSSADVQESKKICRGRKKFTPTEQVTCAVCHQEMINTKWTVHKLKLHNNLAWRMGETPLDLTDQQLVTMILSKVVKKYKKIYCNKCRRGLKSVVGFLSHTIVCGETLEKIEAMKEPCPQCQKKFLPATLAAHIYQIHRVQKPKELQEGKTDFPLEKRKSSRTVNVIQDASSTTAVDHEENEADYEVYKTFLKTYTSYMRAPNNKFLRKFIEEKLKSEESVVCFYEGCCFQSQNTNSIVEHVRRCKMKTKMPFLCKVCLQTLNGRRSVLKHLIEDHCLNPNIDEKYDDNYERDESSEIRKEVAKKNTSFAKIRYYDKKTKIISPNSYEWTTAFYKEYMSQEKLFNSEKFLGTTWHLLDIGSIEKYLPVLSESCDMARLVYKSSLNQCREEYEFKKFQLFESEIYPDGNCTLFCGGPVCSLAWLPTPLDDTVDQILAVGTLRIPNDVHYLDENYSVVSIIQFWNFGKLVNRNKNKYQPKLVFGLAIDFGPVWDMEWCPSGCYNPHVGEEVVDISSRLGLLAVAGSDSFVYIFSVPVCSNTENMSFYKGAPLLKLCPGKPDDDFSNESFYATKISWSKGHGHKFIAVGYSNGMVALFHLTTDSSLIRNKNSEGSNIVYPYFSFQAHLHAITGLHLHHLNEPPRWLMSTSKDKLLNIWDLSNTRVPLSRVKKGAINNALWLNHWLGQIISYDEAASKGFAGCSYKSIRDVFSEITTVLPSLSSVTTLSASDWINCIMQGNRVGEILSVFPDHYQSLVDDKFMRPRRMLLGYTMLIDKKKETCREVETNKEEGHMNSNFNKGTDTSHTSGTFYYQEAQEAYGLLFCDGKLDDYKDFYQQKHETRDWNKILTISKTDVYPLQSITKLAINPNKQATTYYASGYQAGFVRLTCIGFLNSDITLLSGL